MTWIIKFYQYLEGIKRSILFSAFGYHSVCKHRPTCSQYTLQQIKAHGTIRGSYQGLLRILSCW